MTLLQIHEPIEQGIISRLGDQMFCIVLLVTFAFYSIRRQMKLEDKFQSYQDEDRKKMQDVIAENTKALETINIKLGSRISLVLISAGILFLSSCSILKKHTEITTKIDSISSSINVSEISSEFIDRETKDTVLNFEPCSMEGEISAPDLKPIYTLSGDTLPRSHIIKGDGITVDLSIKKDGSLAVKAHTDAKQIVIPNLIRETRVQSKARDSTNGTASKSIAIKDTNTTKTTSFKWPAIVFVILFFLALSYFIFKWLKKIWTK